LISEKIIGCAFTVSNSIGAGFLEKVYQNALVIELLNEVHQAQLINYLKATNLPLGLLLNFGTTKVQIKRMLNDK